MTFSSKVKNELCKIQNEPSFFCSNSELYGMLLCAKKFNADNISFITENKNICKKLSYLLAEEFKVTSDIVTHKNLKKSKFTLLVPYKSDRITLLEQHKNFSKDFLISFGEKLSQNIKIIAAFLRGVFLFSGTITDPNSDYHLEWCVQNKILAEYLKQLILSISKLNINVGITQRKNAYVVYIKGSENISDILTLIGAPICAMEIIQIKMIKEVRNDINRTTNFEAANISKTACAAVKQVRAIEEIKKNKEFENLSEDLKEIANLRLLNPDMSLRDLGKTLSKPLSRSGVNHRLKKLLELGTKQ
ncbi:MAG: putative cell division protein WhiA [Eubacteriales bacterium SKADARSKE-1]|nr:putative cell division protein WhiA [Eubacteriales bacterium SKADARSKE-1]